MSTAPTGKLDKKQPKPKKAKTDTRQAAAKFAGVSEGKIGQVQEVKKAAPSDKYKAPAENIEISPARGARGGGGMVNQAP